MMTEALIVLGVVLVACVIAYFRCPRFKKLFAGIGAGAVAVVVAIVAMKEARGRRREVREKTREVKDGREAATEDTEDTEAALNAAVSGEEDIHKDAKDEQDSLRDNERERLDT